MCGRFTALNPKFKSKVYIEEFDLHGPSMPARYNIGPGQLLLTIARDENKQPVLAEMKWGFIPSWEKSDKPKMAPINAKSEDLAANKVFGRALQSRRCLVLADGYYEWKKLGEDLKEPHYIRLKEGEPFYFAGVFERGRDGRPDTLAILTTTPNSLTEKIHHRMPVIVRGETAKAWLTSGPLAQEEVTRLSAPFPSEFMEEWPVSKAVGNIRNDGPELVVPVAAGEMRVERPSGEQLSLL